jgi:hypothetical protein
MLNCSESPGCGRAARCAVCDGKFGLVRELRKLQMLMRPKRWLARLLTLKASGVHDLMGSITAQPADDMRGERWDARRAAQSRAFYPFVIDCRASKLGLIS